MKYCAILILFFLCLACKGPVKEKQSSNSSKSNPKKKQVTLVGDSLPLLKDAKYQYEIVEKHSIDLNQDGLKDEVLLEKIKDWNDPGDFHAVTVSINNAEKIELLNKDGWINTKEISEFIPDFNDSNLVKSEYLSIKKASNDKFLLFLKGYHYASHPGFLSIVTVVNDKPVLIFNKEVNVFQFEDLNKDGIKDLVTIDCYKQFFNDTTAKVCYLLRGGFEHTDRIN